MNNIMEKLKTTKILGGIGIACLILGIMTPYVKYNIFGYKYSIALWGYWEGKIIMLLALANALFIFKDFIAKYIPAMFNGALGQAIKKCNNPKFSLIPTAICALFAIYITSTLGIKTFKYYNIGFYLIWIGTICLAAYSFLHKGELKSDKSQNGTPVNNMQNSTANNMPNNIQQNNMQYNNVQQPNNMQYSNMQQSNNIQYNNEQQANNTPDNKNNPYMNNM